MVWDLFDRRLLFTLDVNARASFKELGDAIHLSKETARNRLHRLQKNQIITGFYMSTNLGILGLSMYKCYLKLRGHNDSTEHDVFTFLYQFESVSHIQICEGFFDIIFTISAKSIIEVESFFDGLKKSFSDFIAEKSIHVVTLSHRFQKSFLVKEKGSLFTSFFYKKNGDIHVDLDTKDMQILRFLADNARMPAIDIGQKVGLSTKAIIERIRSLERKDIIQDYFIDVDYAALMKVPLVLDVSLKDPSNIDFLIEFFRKNHCCLETHRLIGRYDISLQLIFEDIHQMRKMISRFKNLFSEEVLFYDISYVLESQFYGFRIPDKKQGKLENIKSKTSLKKQIS